MEQYVKYLRKSRFDRDYAELSIEETLKRHEAILDKLAAQRGYLQKPIMRSFLVSQLPQDRKFRSYWKR